MIIKVNDVKALHRAYALILCGRKNKDWFFMAELISRFNDSEGFKFTKELKEELSKEINCSPRSLDRLITYFKNKNFLVKVNGSYTINLKYKFGGDKITIGYENKG